MKKEEILAALKDIENLELEIEARLIESIQPVHDKKTNLELTSGRVTETIQAMADQIVADKSISNPVLISIMDGAFPFASALQAELIKRNYRFEYTTMQATSYAGTKSGELSIQAHPKTIVAGRNVIVLDEVCDTGKTYAAILKKLKQQGANDVRLAVLVDKAQFRLTKTSNPYYRGFVVSKNAFIIGSGLDFKGLVRNLQFIGAVDQDKLPTENEWTLLNRKVALSKALIECNAADTIGRQFKLFKSKPAPSIANPLDFEHETRMKLL